MKMSYRDSCHSACATGAALLALEDGNLFRGVSVGAAGQAVGEVVFNTSMTGYQEILTDPSYARQLVTLTCPHIGNAGSNEEDAESATIHAEALILRDLPGVWSNWRARQGLHSWLREQGCPAIADIDTRRLTRHLRTHGALRACLMAGEVLAEGSEQAAIDAARAFPGLAGMDLARTVTTAEPYTWQQGIWRSGAAPAPATVTGPRFKVVVYDFGVKRSLLRLLYEQGCALTVVSARTPVDEVMAGYPDGVFLSNGPGDPQSCDYAIRATRTLLDAGVPLLGICLGHQILALACGASTVKMKFGHHGANHPVRALSAGQVLITSQNHGFTVDPGTLPDTLETTHLSLFDGSIQGLRHRRRPAIGFQGHPEASPGPHDGAGFFREFVHLMEQYQADAKAH